MKKTLWMIWKNPITRDRYRVGTLTIHDNNYDFRYNTNENDFKNIGFDFFPGFNDINKIYNSQTLFENILNRLPNKNRPDYLKIIEDYGLSESSTDIEILEKTRGRLLTDNFEFVPSFNYDKIEFEVAGTRYSTELKKCKDSIKIGAELLLETEENNKYDKCAVVVKFSVYKLGYVPRYYSQYLYKLLKEKTPYSAHVINLNFDSKIYDEAITVNVKIKFEK